MIEITCPSCATEVLGVVVLGRHLPAGDGTLTYLCNHSARVLMPDSSSTAWGAPEAQRA
jgi:hypothetical protein